MKQPGTDESEKKKNISENKIGFDMSVGKLNTVLGAGDICKSQYAQGADYRNELKHTQALRESSFGI